MILIKLCLNELPALIPKMESEDPKVKKLALEDARWILQLINNEIDSAHASQTVSVEELNAALNNPANFTPQEWETFMEVPKILNKYSFLLAHRPSKDKKHPRTRPHPKV
ncbi:MAG TPA: hypothetical protein VMR37_01140 [Rhabdochlamydiaceae bacterium]|nr:hypothetical protein [Rhabdochlamydiaceae bacterium]